MPVRLLWPMPYAGWACIRKGGRMNFYSASVALLWSTVFGAVSPPAGPRRSVANGSRGACKVRTKPASSGKSCQSRSKREVLP